MFGMIFNEITLAPTSSAKGIDMAEGSGSSSAHLACTAVNKETELLEVNAIAERTELKVFFEYMEEERFPEMALVDLSNWPSAFSSSIL